jgi:hypothetical protein
MPDRQPADSLYGFEKSRFAAGKAAKAAIYGRKS